MRFLNFEFCNLSFDWPFLTGEDKTSTWGHGPPNFGPGPWTPCNRVHGPLIWTRSMDPLSSCPWTLLFEKESKVERINKHSRPVSTCRNSAKKRLEVLIIDIYACVHDIQNVDDICFFCCCLFSLHG